MPSSSGDLLPTVTSETGSDEPWTNATNIEACDDVYTTVDLSVTSPTSNVLTLSGFEISGFGIDSLPGSARLLGFEVSIQWFTTGSGACDQLVLTQNGTQIPGSDNKCFPTVGLPGSEETAVFGGSTDLWNTGLMFVEDMGGSDFGIQLRFIFRIELSIVSVDCVILEVFFEDTLGPFPRLARRVRRIHHINRRIPG